VTLAPSLYGAESVSVIVVMTVVWEGPRAISNISSAKVTISKFGTVVRTVIRSLMIMFQRVGSETDT